MWSPFHSHNAPANREPLEPQLRPQPATVSPASHRVSLSSTFSSTAQPSSSANTTPLHLERPWPPRRPPLLRLPDPEMRYLCCYNVRCPLPPFSSSLTNTNSALLIHRTNRTIQLRRRECHTS